MDYEIGTVMKVGWQPRPSLRRGESQTHLPLPHISPESSCWTRAARVRDMIDMLIGLLAYAAVALAK
jgi:hypothetical protein